MSAPTPDRRIGEYPGILDGFDFVVDDALPIESGPRSAAPKGALHPLTRERRVEGVPQQ
jgi:hypothetical protein